MFLDFIAAVQARHAAVKQVLCDKGIRYSLMVPSKLKIRQEGCTQFCQELDEAWAWLEAYRAGTDRTQSEEPKPPQCRGKRWHTQVPTEHASVTRPTQQQTCQVRRAALQVAASLAEVGVLDKEFGLERVPLAVGESTDNDSVVNMLEGLPYVMPQMADDIA
ncbi:hypothetical protein NDU88_007568 [Pleurodeles waltl]|uniref:Uncharacterized protein n=1 Tax=Pleurodeles waltl TaxID=8319 RepID=A0AAV7RTL5_PLEWA|nr:hypothetical protein NDU88_007568 [Pleurodeles waltl]